MAGQIKIARGHHVARSTCNEFKLRATGHRVLGFYSNLPLTAAVRASVAALGASQKTPVSGSREIIEALASMLVR